MTVKYYLKPNVLTPDPNDQSARTVANAVREVPDIISAMIKRGTTVGYADALAVTNLFFEVMIDELVDGNHVNTPVANFRPSISGVFTSPLDNFDPSRHVLRATVSQGVQLSKAFLNATVQKTTKAAPEPELIDYYDVIREESNVSVKVGSIGQITGSQLKYDTANPEEGIFYINDAGEEFKATAIQKRTEGMLVFIVPAGLIPGPVRLVVRRGYGKDETLTIREGELPYILQVVE